MLTDKFSAFLMRLKDPNIDKPLEDIPVFSDRILSLITRNKHRIRDEHDYTQIRGSIDFLEGIEYHYNNFIAHLQTLAAKDIVENDRMLDHEAVAYLHRVGQFYYFAKSLNLLQDCPKIKELYLFRKKSIGHRSIDVPYIKAGQLEDPLHEQIWQAGCFMRRSFVGKLETDFDYHKDMQKYKEGFNTPKKYLHDQMDISYQILSKGKCADFTPQKDHPVILKEIETLYSRLFSSRPV